MSYRVPDKINKMLSECHAEIDVFLTTCFEKYCNMMPDVEENKAIFIDSVLIDLMANIMINRTHELDAKERYKYIRKALDHVKEVSYRHISSQQIKSIEDDTEQTD